ncbi:GtrA family protein [Duganella levis]|uniref:GtrA family protein n=1 Tax=Duganella levis TaxID=2692169 RepID=A0ABW9W578_9BURK|nr:GtrA family protein [Duganella levis]MYN29089.1 GtrA family protein [Duganella levis]
MPDRRSVIRFVTYAMVGAVGTLAQYVVLASFVSLHWAKPVTASVIGALVGAVINYLLNARFTFGSTAHSSALPKFAATAIFGAAVNGLLMKVLIDFANVNYLVAQVIASAAVLAITYSLNLVWTFRRSNVDAKA